MTVQTTTTPTGVGQLAPGAPERAPRSFLSRLLAGIAASREERGQRIAYVHLARLSDAALQALGHDRRRIEDIRRVANRGVISY